MNLDPQTVSIVLGLALPILVGVVTKAQASSRIKSITLAALAAISGGISQAVTADGSAILSQETLTTIVLTFVTAIASYYGLYKPTGIAPAVQAHTAQFGIGQAATGDSQ